MLLRCCVAFMLVLAGGLAVQAENEPSLQQLWYGRMQNGTIANVAASPNGKLVAGANPAGVFVWDVEKGQRVVQFTGHAGGARSVAFSKDSSLVLSAGRDKTIQLWSASDGTVLRTFRGHTNIVNAAAFLPGGKFIFSGSFDRTARLWDLETGAELKKFEALPHGVMTVAVSGDGRYAIGGGFRVIHIWDLRGIEAPRTVEAGEGWIFSLVFLGDGQRFVSGGYDNTVRLWDRASGQELRRIEDHPDNVRALDVSPDGRFLLSAADDGSLRLWDVETGQLRSLYDGEEITTLPVAKFHGRGRVVIGGMDSTVRILQLP